MIRSFLEEKVYVMFLLALGLGCAHPEPTFNYREIDSKHGKNVVTDLDNDGRNDIVTLITGEDGGLIWYKHNSDNTLKKNVILEHVYFRGDRVAAADLDGDGDQDLVTGFRDNGEELYVVWLCNPLPAGKPDVPGSWEMSKIGYHALESEGARAYTKDIGIADFDGDGKLDVATRTNIMTRIFFQVSPTEWAKKVEMEHENHEGMDVGDLDQDGDPDLILNGFWFETPADPLTQPFAKHIIDEKWFTQTEGTWRDDNASVKVADINGDGLLDLLISHSEKPGFPVSYYAVASRDQVRSGPWTENRVAEVFDFCQSLDAGDIDNDGDLDILAAQFERDHGGERWRNYPPFPVVVFYNERGDGTTWKQQQLSEKGMYAGILGDVGSDGDLDIVAPRSYWTGPTDMYENSLNDR
jgi:hypothetical protein